MKPALRLGCLVLAMFLIGSARAEADIWDWLSELNGPGPSHSRGNVMINIFCSDSEKKGTFARAFQIPKDPKVGTCFFFDTRRFRAEEDARFYRVDSSVTEFGTSVRLHAAVELGAGIGWMRFNSENPTTTTEFEGTRLTISFPRLVFKPLLAAPVARLQNDGDWGFFQMYFRETIVVGDLTQDDFASKPGTVFDRRHQRVRSMGFIIDLPSGVRLLIKAFN